MFGVIEFSAASGLFPKDVVDVFERWFEHSFTQYSPGGRCYKRRVRRGTVDPESRPIQYGLWVGGAITSLLRDPHFARRDVGEVDPHAVSVALV